MGTVQGWLGDLARLSPGDDGEGVEALSALERVKAAAAAAQARIAVDLDVSQRRVQAGAGVRARDLGTGVAAQVALARRDSPARGARHLGLAHALVEELPHTLAALERGETSEWRATLVARETACLSRRDRGVVDAELAARPGGLGRLGDRAVACEARRIAYRLDPVAFTDRAARAERERRVTLRPAPETMSVLSGLLPVRQGVAVLASLTRHADTLRCQGDDRSRGQIMADTLVERVTGQATAAAVPLEVQVVISDQALLGSGAAPARVAGYGPVPAPLARSWIRDTHAPVWLRRLYATPATGDLVAMDSRRRRFAGQLRQYLLARDEVCRTPWCGAPIRHLDHPHRAADGGPTDAANAQGLCQACNLAKEGTGWHAAATDQHVVTTTTGHRYPSHPPPLPPPAHTTPAEHHFTNLVLTAWTKPPWRTAATCDVLAGRVFNARLSSPRGPACCPAVQRQVRTEKPRTRCDRIAHEAKTGAGRVSAPEPRDQRAEQEERGYVRAHRVHRTDPTLGTRHLRPVPGARDGGRSRRRQPGSDQERCGAPCLRAAGKVEKGCTHPAPERHIGEQRMHRVAENVGVQRAPPCPVDHRSVDVLLRTGKPLGEGVLAHGPGHPLRKRQGAHPARVRPGRLLGRGSACEIPGMATLTRRVMIDASVDAVGRRPHLDPFEKPNVVMLEPFLEEMLADLKARVEDKSAA